MATITEPMALDGSFNTTETNPRNIADVLAEMGEAIAQGMGRQANEVSYDNTTSGLSADDVQDAVDELAEEKVDKVSGKGLSTNDYTTEEKNKLAGIEAGAQVNVQSDWAQTDSSEDDFIKNKQLVTEPIEELQNDVKSTQTVSGNPLTLTDAAPINAESLVVELEPKQDLHGQSAPYVGGAGKNKLPMTVEGIKAANTSGTWSGNVYTINSGTFTILTDSDGNVTGIKVNGTFNANTLLTLGTTSLNGSYILNGCPNGGYMYTYRMDLRRSTGGDILYTDEGSGVNIDNINESAYVVIRIQGQYQAYNLIFLPMIRLATETDPTFAPYSNICPITGYDECEVDDVGKNLFDVSKASQGKAIAWNNASLFTESDSWVSDYLEVEQNTNYIANKNIDQLLAFDENKTNTYTYKDGGWVSGGSSGNNCNSTFSVPTGVKYIRFSRRHVTSSETDSASFQLEKVTQSTSYEPYHSSNATIQFGQTVMGGKVNVTDGGTDDEQYNLDDFTDITFNSNQTGANAYEIYFTTSNKKSGVDNLMTNLMPVKTSFTDIAEFSCRGYTNSGSVALKFPKSIVSTPEQAKQWCIDNGLQVVYEKATPTTIQTPQTDLKLLKGTNNLSTNGTNIQLGYQPDNVIGEVKGEIEDVTPISGTATVTLLHEEDQGEDWIVGFTGEINGHFDIDHFDYYLTARYTHAYNTNTQILNMNNCTDGDYVNIWQTGNLDFSVDGGVTVDISVTETKLTFTVNCIGDSIFGIYSSSETTGEVKYLITPARKG